MIDGFNDFKRFVGLLTPFFFSFIAAHAQNAYLQGCIEGAQNDSITLSWINETDTDWEQIMAPLDAAGCFQLRFTPPSNLHKSIELNHAGQIMKLHLTTGDSLVLTVSFWQFDSSKKYQGSAAVKNAYLADENLRINLPLKNKGSLINYYQRCLQLMPPYDYLKEMDSLQSARWQLLESWGSKLTPAYYHLFKEQIRFETAFQKAMYFPLRNFISRQNPKVSRLEQIVGFEDFLFDLSWNDPRMHGFYYYRESNRLAMMCHLEKDPTHLKAAASLRRLRECRIIDSLSGEQSSDYLMANFLTDHIKASSSAELTEALQYFMQKSKDEALKANVQALYDEYSQLKPGVEAPAFSLTDTKGRTVSLSDFKGKVVYIDFWASWCMPCIAEFKYLPALKAILPSDSVVMLYINVDDQKNRWLQASAKHLPGELDLWAGDLFKSEVAKAYQVHGVPKYVLIDRHGIIFKLNAARPSKPEGVLKEVREAAQ